jgi:hypothetical protein
MFEYFFILLCCFPETPLDNIFSNPIFYKPINRAHIILNLRLETDNNWCNLYSLRKESKESFQKRIPNPSYLYHFGYTDFSQTKELLLFSNAYIENCKRNISIGNLHEQEVWYKILKEAEHLHTIYDLVDDSVRPQYSLYQRRLALFKIKKLIGEEDFYKGKLPPNIPIWRFSEKD